ncbi:MAG: thioesterase family protein [Anaerolineales bacterium]|jgi:hypothetical protein
MSEKTPLPLLTPGLNAEVEMTVSETETASHLGSGTIPVYASPALVALMENAAVRSLEGRRPDHSRRAHRCAPPSCHASRDVCPGPGRTSRSPGPQAQFPPPGLGRG